MLRIYPFLERYLKAVILLIVVCVHFQYVRFDTMLNRDDNVLIPPLSRIESISGYINAVKTNQILDVQPLRDLTFLINIKIHEWTRFSAFHLFNLIFFLIAIVLVGRLLEELKFRRATVLTGMAIFAFHPLMVSAVGWVSARKHSLAIIFVLLAIIDFIKKENVTLKGAVWFFLSVLSHQIFCLLPFWILFMSWKKKWKLNWFNFGVMIALAWSVVIIATLKTFLMNTGNTIYLKPDYFTNISRYVLSIGRSFTLIVFPVSVSAFYWQGSFWNITGIPLLIGFLFALYRHPLRKEILPWMLLALLAHLPTYIAFVNDTYLYIPLVCTIICAAYLIDNSGLSNRNRVIIVSVILTLLVAKTISISSMWRNTQNMWSTSYENEPSPHNAIGVSGFVKDPREALRLLSWGAKNYDFEDRNLMNYFFTSVIQAPVTRDEKVRIFEESFKDDPKYKSTFAFFLLEGDDSEIRKGIGLLKEVIAGKIVPADFENNLFQACKKNNTICEQLNIPGSNP